jgi:hypothetical protein
MIFPEMMAEMRRPMDFWKGMVRLYIPISPVSRPVDMFPSRPAHKP